MARAPALRQAVLASAATRSIMPRLAGVAYAPCRRAAHDAPSDWLCFASSRDVAWAIDAAARVRAELSRARSVDALWASALLDLTSDPFTPAAVERALARLEEASGFAPNNPELQNDLAVANMLRAQITADPSDLLRALDILERAAQRDSLDRGLLFNRWLVLRRLALEDEAREAARQYLKLDPSSGWAREIARDTTADVRAAVSLPADSGPQARLLTRAEATRFAASEPERAREYAATRLLGSWASAVLRGDKGAATTALDAARAAGEVLARSDGSIVDAVESIGRAQGADELRLASAHAAYARGRELFERASFIDAESELRRSERLFRGERFRAWPLVLLGGIAVYDGRYGTADSLVSRVLSAANPARYASLSARAHWTLGLSLGRQGRLELALQQYRAARALFIREGDRANVGSVEMLIAEAETLLGRGRPGIRWLYRALADLRTDPSGPRLHDTLLYAARDAAQRGYLGAAVALHREDARVAARTGRSKDIVEALVSLAQAHAAAGDDATAATDLVRARAAFTKVVDPLMRQRIAADLADAQAAVLLRTAPARAAAQLSVEVDHFRHQHNPTSLVRALTRRSAAYARAGDEAHARGDLAVALSLVESEADSLRSPELKASLNQAALPVYDALLALEVRAGRPDSAFAILERSRGRPDTRELEGNGQVLPVAARAQVGARSVDEIARALPAGRVLVDYAVLPDRVLIWAARRAGVRFASVVMSSSALALEVDRFVRLVRAGVDSLALQRAGIDLYGQLLAPVADRLAGADELVIVPDGPLHRLPFAALATRDGHFLVERLTVATAARTGSGRLPALRPAPRVLSVAVGAGAAGEEELAPLPGAAAEAEHVAHQYGRGATLTGPSVGRGRIMRELPRFDVVHFAGHARYRADDPGASFLVLGPGATDRLYGSDIAALRLRRVELVVLSACSTGAIGDARARGLDGLAQAFLSAGAGGVVGTLWEVDDQSAGMLALALHQRLRQGIDAAHALREAQLGLLRAPDPALHQPAAWAAFQLDVP